MDEADMSEEGKQLLEIVKEETHHLAAIVDDFLQFAKPKKPIYHEEDINQLIKDVIKRYKDWQEKKIQWVEELDESLPKINVDRHQIQQVLTNLMLNSIDAMQDNGILTIKTEKPIDNRIKITIMDSGAGIAHEELAKIFQPFYSTKEKGTGMGLAICRRIINNHYGDILVDSELGMGSTFTILIPLDLKSQ
jgi:two-component system sensor histidine kinase AtoS